MGMHPYECAASCRYCSEDTFRDSVRDTVGAMSVEELRAVMEDVSLYPGGSLSEDGEAIVLEAVETELAIHEVFE